MLASQIAWYSLVSGGSWRNPAGFFGSHWAGPVLRLHWPLQFGYLDSSCACAAIVMAVSSTMPASELRSSMAILSQGSRILGSRIRRYRLSVPKLDLLG